MKNTRLTNYALGCLIIFLPYNLIGEGFIGTILSFIVAIYIVKNNKHVEISNLFKDNRERAYLYLLIVLVGVAVISTAFSKDFISSLNGLTLYICTLLFYVFFRSCIKEKHNVLKAVVFAAVISSALFIIYEGLILNKRISGGIGYANTYALVLIIGLYLNSIVTNEKLKWIFEYILVLGVIYTGSRNSLLYLIIYIVLVAIYNFNEKKLLTFGMPLLGVITYICFEYLGLGIIFVLPIAIYIGYIIIRKMSFRIKNYLTAALIIISVFSVFTSKNDYIERIKNISIKTPVLQERFVYFEDALKSIVKNPLGYGINSFEYLQYEQQSAFYDVKYIHNSILQIGYDLGVLGGVIFLSIAIYGLYILYCKKGEVKKYFLPIYATIFFHSLLDFDFSYPTIFILFVMLVAISETDDNKDKIIENKNYRIDLWKRITCGTAALAIAFSGYLIFVNSTRALGEEFENSRELNKALAAYKIEKSITIKNPKVYVAISQIYNEMFDESKDTKYLKMCIENLEKARNINPHYPSILGNLAFTHEKLGDKKQAIRYYDEFITKEKYYKEIYVIYKEFLDREFSLTKDNFYKDKREELIKLYKLNKSTLNPKAKYMKDQMNESFME